MAVVVATRNVWESPVIASVQPFAFYADTVVCLWMHTYSGERKTAGGSGSLGDEQVGIDTTTEFAPQHQLWIKGQQTTRLVNSRSIW